MPAWRKQWISSTFKPARNDSMKALSKSALHLSGSPHGLSESSRPAGAELGCRLKYILAVSAHIFCFSQFIRIFYIGFCQVFSAETIKKHSSLYGESMVYCIRTLLFSGSVCCISSAIENRKTVFKAGGIRRRMKCTRRFQSTVWPLCGSCGGCKARE